MQPSQQKSRYMRRAAFRASALLAGALFCLALISFQVMARDINQDEALQLRREGKLVPLNTLLQTARQRYPAARLLEVELESEDGQLIYELEILTAGGKVRELEFDAAAGDLLKDEEED